MSSVTSVNNKDISLTSRDKAVFSSVMLAPSIFSSYISYCIARPWMNQSWRTFPRSVLFGASMALMAKPLHGIFAVSSILAGRAISVDMEKMAVLNKDDHMKKLMNCFDKAPFYVMIGGPIQEELMFRGLIQPALISACGLYPGVLGTSVVFGFVHMIKEVPLKDEDFRKSGLIHKYEMNSDFSAQLQAGNAVMTGLVLGVLKQKMGLAAAIGFHCMNNTLVLATIKMISPKDSS